MIRILIRGGYALGVLCMLGWLDPALAVDQERTYEISLVKTAESARRIQRVGDQKVLTETVTVREGEWVWRILREKGLLKRKNLAELLAVLKKLNRSLGDLDLVHPGDQIVVPLKIAPVGEDIAQVSPEDTVPVTDLEDVEAEKYTVKSGDSIVRIVKGRYDIPDEDLYGRYLDLVRRMNPEVRDLDRIYPGQVVRLPIYTPEIVRRPIKTPPAVKEEAPDRSPESIEKRKNISGDLAEIFRQMGEKWIDSGEHLIPLKSGGEIDLQAGSFPVLELKNGLQVIVDLNDKLPRKIARLIESSWGNYRVVHLGVDQDLYSALDELIGACEYPEVLDSDRSMALDGDISVTITGDWIVKRSVSGTAQGPQVAVITIRGPGEPATPPSLKGYLEKMGVKMIDHPPVMGPELSSTGSVQAMDAGDDEASLVKSLLRQTEQRFSTEVAIPVYQSRKDFNLVIEADILLNIHDRDAIITWRGLDPEVRALLKEHRFRVLSLTDLRDPLAIMAKTLQFLDWPFEPSPRVFVSTERETGGKVELTLEGSTFMDADGNGVFAAPASLPEEIALFLSRKGYRILRLPSSPAISGFSNSSQERGSSVR